MSTPIFIVGFSVVGIAQIGTGVIEHGERGLYEMNMRGTGEMDSRVIHELATRGNLEVDD